MSVLDENTIGQIENYLRKLRNEPIPPKNTEKKQPPQQHENQNKQGRVQNSVNNHPKKIKNL